MGIILHLKHECINKHFLYIEFDGKYTIDELREAQEEIRSIIECHRLDNIISIFDFRTASLPFSEVDMQTWRIFNERELPSVKGYVLIGKSMFLSIYGNLVMRLFGTKLTYARNLEQALTFARQLLPSQEETSLQT